MQTASGSIRYAKISFQNSERATLAQIPLFLLDASQLQAPLVAARFDSAGFFARRLQARIWFRKKGLHFMGRGSADLRRLLAGFLECLVPGPNNRAIRMSQAAAQSFLGSLRLRAAKKRVIVIAEPGND